MKRLSILSFFLALTTALTTQWTMGSLLIVVSLIGLGAFSLDKHYKKLAHEKSKQAAAGNIDWQRYDRKPDETDKILSRIEPFFRYGVPPVILMMFFANAVQQAAILAVLYIVYLWQNHSAKKSER